MPTTQIVSAATRALMLQCVVEDDSIAIPPGTGGRIEDEVGGILTSLGGAWNKRTGAYEFAAPRGEDLAEAFYAIAANGHWAGVGAGGYAPPPDWLVAKLRAEADLRPGLRVLELGLTAPTPNVMTVADTGPFDRIVLVPPFEKSQPVVHVESAIAALLTPGGRLAAIMPVGIVQRQDRPHRTLRAALLRHGRILALPEDAFAGAGRGARLCLVVYDKPEPTGEARPTGRPA